jgi:hypothetical protein
VIENYSTRSGGRGGRARGGGDAGVVVGHVHFRCFFEHRARPGGAVVGRVPFSCSNRRLFASGLWDRRWLPPCTRPSGPMAGVQDASNFETPPQVS